MSEITIDNNAFQTIFNSNISTDLKDIAKKVLNNERITVNEAVSPLSKSRIKLFRNISKLYPCAKKQKLCLF